MHPAPSVIIFSVCSGMGFGLLAFLGLGFILPSGITAFLYFLVAYALAVGGLIASTLHLGNPKNAMKAFSQWRTSWLSREGIAAVAALVIMGLYAIGAIFFGMHLRPIGWIAAILSILTVFTTSMIYAQLKTVPRWNQWSTPLMFLIFSLTGGAILAGQITAALVLLAALAIIQTINWLQGDGQFAARGSTIETATGLGNIGKVRQFEPPHTGTNYLMKEMIYVIGRKHSIRLRLIAAALALLVPFLVLTFLPLSFATIALAAITHLVGAFASRWLFFAEAEHMVGLYYGQR